MIIYCLNLILWVKTTINITVPLKETCFLLSNKNIILCFFNSRRSLLSFPGCNDGAETPRAQMGPSWDWKYFILKSMIFTSLCQYSLSGTLPVLCFLIKCRLLYGKLDKVLTQLNWNWYINYINLDWSATTIVEKWIRLFFFKREHLFIQTYSCGWHSLTVRLYWKYQSNHNIN